MKFFKLLFLVTLGTIVTIGCERQLVSPINPTNASIATLPYTQLAQRKLLDFADMAASHGFLNLANATTEFVEALTTEDQTFVQPTFSKLDRFASEITYLDRAFARAGCSIDALRSFAEATVETVKAWTIRDTAEMDRALQNLAQEAGTANIALQQLSIANRPFRPFAFGYSSRYVPRGCGVVLGIIALEYEKLDIGINETEAVVIDFLTSKGYEARHFRGSGSIFGGNSFIALDAQVNIGFIEEAFGEELRNIPNVMYITPAGELCEPAPTVVIPPPVYELHKLITNSISDRYNEAWCQGNLDVNAIDSILIEESGLDFFNYAFLRNLVDIYVEEKPETAERIRSNIFSFRSIVLAFLRLYLFSWKTPDELIEMYPRYAIENYGPVLEPSDSKVEKIEITLDEIIERFRQAVKSGNVHIEADKAPVHYYY